MPLDRLILILVSVVACAACTVAFGVLLAASIALPGWAALAAAPMLIALYVAYVVIRDRVRNPQDSYYDKIER